VKAEELISSGLDVVVGVHVFIGVKLPRPPRSTDQRKREEGGRLVSCCGNKVMHVCAGRAGMRVAVVGIDSPNAAIGSGELVAVPAAGRWWAAKGIMP
jgi:hypothetical protein